MDNAENNQQQKNSFVVWLKRLGVAGFLFFTIKGLLWLIIPAMIVWFGTMR